MLPCKHEFERRTSPYPKFPDYKICAKCGLEKVLYGDEEVGGFHHGSIIWAVVTDNIKKGARHP